METTMTKKKVNESLSEYASSADSDHEVQMARADLYNLSHQSIKLHKILSTISEEQGLEGWQQAKITKAADYINSVFTSLQHNQTMTTAPMPPPPPAIVSAGVRSAMSETQIADYKALLEKAKSKAQQKFMGMVHAAQKGEEPASKAVADVAKDMPKKAAKDYAATKHKGLPAHVKEVEGKLAPLHSDLKNIHNDTYYEGGNGSESRTLFRGGENTLFDTVHKMITDRGYKKVQSGRDNTEYHKDLNNGRNTAIVTVIHNGKHVYSVKTITQLNHY